MYVIIYLDEKKIKEHIGFHYLLTEIQQYTLTFFWTEYVPQELLNKIRDKSITNNIFRIQDNDSIECRFYVLFS